MTEGLLNEHDHILPEFDLKNSDNESEDSASDSEVESGSDDSTSTRNAEKIDEAYNFIGIRGPLASLYAVRYALLNSEYDEVVDLTKDLLKLNENKIKEPITFVLARYLACLRYRIQSLPERRERRELPAHQARIIVSLKSSNFVAILDELDKKWGRPMPEALYSDEIVCGMLIPLEDSMFANFYVPKSSPLRIFDLDWSADAPSKALPLPILGLDFTLTFYFPTTPINLSNIRKLSLNSWPITVLPSWISRMPFLVYLRISNTNIECLPAWLTKLKHLMSFEVKGSPCLVRDHKRYTPQTHHHTTLVDTAAARILEFIANGGDWTETTELPNHLINKVLYSHYTRFRQHQLLRHYAGDKTVSFEEVDGSDLPTSPWRALIRRHPKTTL